MWKLQRSIAGQHEPDNMNEADDCVFFFQMSG